MWSYGGGGDAARAEGGAVRLPAVSTSPPAVALRRLFTAIAAEGRRFALQSESGATAAVNAARALALALLPRSPHSAHTPGEASLALMTSADMSYGTIFNERRAALGGVSRRIVAAGAPDAPSDAPPILPLFGVSSAARGADGSEDVEPAPHTLQVSPSVVAAGGGGGFGSPLTTAPVNTTVALLDGGVEQLGGGDDDTGGVARSKTTVSFQSTDVPVGESAAITTAATANPPTSSLSPEITAARRRNSIMHAVDGTSPHLLDSIGGMSLGGEGGEKWVTTLTARIRPSHIGAIARRVPAVGLYLRSGSPFLSFSGGAQTDDASPPIVVGVLGVIAAVVNSTARLRRGIINQPRGGSTLFDSLKISQLEIDDASKVLATLFACFAADTSSDASGVRAILLQLHAASIAEAARRRLGALALEAEASGRSRLASTLASWVPVTLVPAEGRVAVSATAGGGRPCEHRHAQTLTAWPLPFRVSDGLSFRGAHPPRKVSARALAIRFRVVEDTSVAAAEAAPPHAGGGNQTPLPKELTRALCEFVVHGALVTPFGQRLTHPQAVLLFALCVAQEGAQQKGGDF